MAIDSLKSKTIKGMGWSAVDNFSQYAISFLVSIILARLLTPDDYGLIGIITIFTTYLNCIDIYIFIFFKIKILFINGIF